MSLKSGVITEPPLQGSLGAPSRQMRRTGGTGPASGGRAQEYLLVLYRLCCLPMYTVGAKSVCGCGGSRPRIVRAVCRVRAPSPLTPPSSSLFLPSCVAEGQPLHLPRPQFPHLCNGDQLDPVQGSRRDFPEGAAGGRGQGPSPWLKPPRLHLDLRDHLSPQAPRSREPRDCGIRRGGDLAPVQLSTRDLMCRGRGPHQGGLRREGAADEDAGKKEASGVSGWGRGERLCLLGPQFPHLSGERRSHSPSTPSSS